MSLGELGTWTGGGTPSKAQPEFWAGGTIPWISPKDMKVDVVRDGVDYITEEAVATSATSVVPAPAVLLVVRSGILKHTLPVALSAADVALNQDMKALSPSAHIDPGYATWALRRFAREILHTCSKAGTTVASIEFPSLLRFLIPVAPVSEQRRIVAAIEEHLSRLDAAVAALKRVRASLPRYRAALLKAACEGRLLDSVRQSVPHATSEAVESNNLPTLPAGWRWSTVRELAAPEPRSITDGPFGSNLKTSHYTNSGPRVIRLQNIGDGEFVDEYAHISDDHFARLRKHEVFAGDIVIATLGGRPPRACMIPGSVGRAIVKADCIRFKPDSRSGLSAYFNIALNAEPTRSRISRRIHGVGRPRLNLSEIKAIEVPVPPIAEQRLIVAEVDRRLSLADAADRAVSAGLAKAKRLRQAILKRAFDGKLVPQDPNDEPASVLLERIKASRAL